MSNVWQKFGCAAILAALAGCGGTPAAAPTLIAIDGSSTVFPVTEAMAEEFQKSQNGAVRVTVGISGTGGGFKKFYRGEIDIADASRPILAEEMAEAKKNQIDYIELPICFDALTVAIHPENTWAKTLTVSELKKIWAPEADGKVLLWSDVRPEWPKEKLALFGAGADSGTFDYFTEAIVGKAKSSRKDYTPSEDDNVLVQGIEGNKYALGYLPYAYYAAHAKRMQAVAIQWDKLPDAQPVLPNAENVLNGIYNPLSRPLFIYVSRKAADRPEVQAFVEFYLTKGVQLVQEVKYLPLPKEIYAQALERFKARKIGTGFGGKPEVGLPIDKLMKREPAV